MLKKMLIFVLLLTLVMPLYAQEEAGNNKAESTVEAVPASEGQVSEDSISDSTEDKEGFSFSNFLNTKAYAAPLDKKEERRILRRRWEELIGVDIFYPYFKAKEVEDWASEKASVEILKIKGRPKFEDDQIKYTFQIKF